MTEQTQRFNFVALQLCFLLAVVYFGQMITGFEPGFNPSMSPVWKFFTSIFGHSDLQHLANNLFFIGLFGSLYERFTSGRTFFLTFLVSALFANLSAFIFFPESFIIGASGGASGVLAAFAVYKPRQIGLALGVPLPMWAVLLGYVFINTAGLTGATNVAYEAHLLGMVTGALIGLRHRDQIIPEDNEKDEELEEGEDSIPEENWREEIREWEEKWMM